MRGIAEAEGGPVAERALALPHSLLSPCPVSCRVELKAAAVLQGVPVR